MGQGSSTAASPPSPEELALRLTNIFAEKCFSPSELRCFKQTFKSLAEEQSKGVTHWSEDTLVKFLELPDALGSGAVLYQLCSHIGAFPFPSHAPAVLTGDALLRVVCLMTGRYLKVLQGGKETWRREIWKALTIDPKKTSSAGVTNGRAAPVSDNHSATAQTSTTGKNTKEEDGDDDLAFHAFELLNALEAHTKNEVASVQNGTIPSESFLKLLQLLLLIAPLGPAENVSLYTTQLDGKRLEGLHAAAKCILASFGVEQSSGVGYKTFDAVVTNTLPHLFDSLDPLFEHFLFPKDFDVHKSKASAPEPTPSSSEAPNATVASRVEPAQIPAPEPLLPVQGDILDLNLLSQLSFIFSDNSIFHRLRPLYLGHKHGYSMGSFEKSVFKWHAPSIFLVSGTLISPTTKQSHARTFLDELPHRRLSSSVNSPQLLEESATTTYDTQRIIYGAYIPVPWKATNKTTFGTSDTTLFQLSPVHDVFPASSSGNQNFSYFNKPPSLYSGLGFGSPLPIYSSMTASQQSSGSRRRSSVTSYSASDTAYGSGSFTESQFSSPSSPSSPGLTRRSSLIGDEHIPLGPVSLHIDDALEFGVFTHLSSGSGSSSSFLPSKLPKTARAGGDEDWQDRFEIDAIEVWGVGDASVAEEQRKEWLWETREAERRKRVNLGTGDVEADRELLKLAGLIRDEERSGGSVG